MIWLPQSGRIFVIVSFFLLYLSCTSLSRESPRFASLYEESSWAEVTLHRLSLEEKVGQLIQIRYYADYVSRDDTTFAQLREQLEKYHIGSAAFSIHRNNQGPVRIASFEAAKVSNQLQQISSLPLLLAADLERGLASRLNDAPAFPWPMAFGAANDPEDVEKFASMTATQARAVGIHWIFAPVADVNDNPANPVINTRAYSDDPEMVAGLVGAFIRGAHQNGLIVTAKHFPGSGNTTTDSHLGIASVDSDIRHLQSVELVPFKRAIDMGVDAIMPAHARVPAIESNHDKIATVSPKVVNGLLKGQLGFTGLIVTDALEMQGLIKLYDPSQGSPTARAAVDAIKAGCDIISIPTDLDGAFHAIISAVHSGEIQESRIDESVRKILRVKASLGLDKSRLVDLSKVEAVIRDPQSMDFAQHIADSSVTLVRDNNAVLPLRSTESSTGLTKAGATSHRLVALLLDEAFASNDGREFEKALKSRRSDAEVFYFDNRTAESVSSEALKAIAEADQVILVVYAAHNGVRHVVVGGKMLSSFGPLGPSGKLLENALAAKTKQSVVVALGNPYLILNFPEIETYVCTYSQTATSEVALVKAMFGEIENNAKLPINLPGVAARGFSIRWPTTPTSAP